MKAFGQKRWTVWALFVCLCSIVSLTIACEGKPQVIKCSSDRDCPVDYQCIQETRATTTDSNEAAALMPPCTVDGRCGGTTPSTTTEGSCQIKPQPKPEGCQSDADCSSNQYCSYDGGTSTDAPTSGGGAGFRAAPVTGRCVDRPTCKADSDCPSHQYCQARTVSTKCGTEPAPNGNQQGDVAMPAPKCAGTTVIRSCVDRPQNKRCHSANDCASDEICQFATTEPTPTPDTDENKSNKDVAFPMPPQPAGVCVKKPVKTCTNNDQCGKNEVCDLSGNSSSGSTGSGSTGTDPDQTEPGGDKEVRAPGQLPAPPPPVQGVCKPKPPTTCKSDSDCGSNQKCQMSDDEPTTKRAPTQEPAPCDPGADNCGGVMPPPPPTTGVCVDKVTCTATKDKNGTVCVKCSDGTSKCTTEPPNPEPEPQPEPPAPTPAP